MKKAGLLEPKRLHLRLFPYCTTTIPRNMRSPLDLHHAIPGRELPLKHILSRAIGPFPTVTPSIESCVFKRGDLFLLCSDGLTNSLTDSEINEVLSQEGGCAKKGNHLMQFALEKGGRDNVTFILVQIGDDQS